jgi:hypothetical protein
LVRGDRFDLNWRDVHGPTITFQGCALATDTSISVVVCDLVEHDQLNDLDNSCKQLKK